jgi:replicative DNA helicase
MVISREKTSTSKNTQEGSKQVFPRLDPEPRSLPFSEDAEKGVLCSMLLNATEVSDLCRTFLREGAFYIPAHELVYNLILELVDGKKPIDFITLRQALKDRNQLEEIGGVEYVSDLYSFVPSAANAEYYIAIVREKYILRRLILTCGGLSRDCYEQQDELEPLLDRAEREILQIAADTPDAEWVPIKERVLRAYEQIEALYQSKGAVTGLPTGFQEFDRMTGGLQPKDMIVIAARPSMGKTAWAMNVAEYLAVDRKIPVMVYSLEMGGNQLTQRLLCSRAKVNLQKVRDGFLADHSLKSLCQAAAELAAAPLYLDDCPTRSIAELKAHSRRMKRQHDIQLIVIDYLQLLRSSSKKAQDNRQIEISEISAGIKSLAKELDIPIIAVAQLNRNPDARSNGGRPRLSDLRESGSIEQDADLVALLIRPEYYANGEEEKEQLAGEAELIIAKQRNGPTGDIPLTFLKEFTRFENRAQSGEIEPRKSYSATSDSRRTGFWCAQP